MFTWLMPAILLATVVQGAGAHTTLTQALSSCGGELQGNVNHHQDLKIELNRFAQQELHKLRVSAGFEDSLQGPQKLFFLTDKIGVRTLVFDSHEDDRGYQLRGTLKGDVFEVKEITLSNLLMEQEFFRVVATALALPRVTLDLDRKIMGCSSVRVKRETQVKLWLKHGSDVETVRQALNGGGEPKYSRSDARGDKYAIKSQLSDGRTLRTVILANKSCPHLVITSFEIY